LASKPGFGLSLTSSAHGDLAIALGDLSIALNNAKQRQTPVSMGICSSKSSARTFTSAQAKGGCELDLSKTALVLIEYQDEFTTEGGKLHGAVAESMKETDMLAKSAKVVAAARAKGITVIHVPITFKEDASDNPNKGIGILAGCAKDKLFTAGTWNADFHESMKPVKGDIVVNGKRGLDGFPGTDLEARRRRPRRTLSLSTPSTRRCPRRPT